MYEPPGDILCFLTGEEEIENAADDLRNRVMLLPEK